MAVLVVGHALSAVKQPVRSRRLRPAGRHGQHTGSVAAPARPRGQVRGTRLVDLVNTMDPKLAAAAFGMDPQAALTHLADHVDAGRLPEP